MKHLFLLSSIAVLFLSNCQHKFDQPRLPDQSEGAEIFVRSIRARVPEDGQYHRFATRDSCLFCTVLADERNNNLNRQVFCRDDAGDAIRLHLVSSGVAFTGDRLRIRLNGLYAINSGNMIYIDSIDILRNAVKISSGNTSMPLEKTLGELLSIRAEKQFHPLQSQLVKLTGVEFIPNTNPVTFAYPISGAPAEQTLRDCYGNQLKVRTSGYADFAGKSLPPGNGSLIGIVTQFNDRLQFVIRSYEEIRFDAPPCAVSNPSASPSAIYLKKDFNDFSVTSGGWSTQTMTNSYVNWSVSSYSTTPTPFAKISGFVQGSNRDAECWLISPTLNLQSAGSPYLAFQTAAKYPGNLLDVLVSNNYQGGAPVTGQWISLAGSYSLSPSTGSYEWTASGKIPLTAFKTGPCRIAFKYSSSTSGATTYELDDIVVQED